MGIPQGTAPSFLLANMLLHDLDEGLISDAFKYYRYMDDINIYGYSEFDLLKALLIIDKYTKGCGLSINAKKTSIEEIKEGNDSKIKELKKVDFFSLIEEDYEELEIEDSQKQQDQEKKLKKKAARLSEQDGDSWEDEYGSQTIILKNEKEIKKFWTQNIERVRKELPKLFLNPKASIANLKLNEDVDDLDFIKLSTIYGTSIKAMKEWGVIIKPHNDLLNYWLFAYKKFFWRANNLNHTLLLYQNNSELKNHLTNLLTTDFELFEWVRYFVIMNLSLAHSFTDRELRQVYFKLLKAEESDLARISYYRLLFKHSCNKQFTDTITRELHKETNPYLKMLIADFNKNHLSEGITIENFLNSIGL